MLTGDGGRDHEMESYKPTSKNPGANEVWWKISSVFLATVAIVTVLLFCWTKRRLWELAARLPGPTPVPLLGNLLTFAGCDLIQFFKMIVQLVEKHGSIFKLWIGQDLFVLLSDPVALEKVLGNKNFIRRTGYVTKVGKPFFRNGLLMSDGDTWRVHRKIIQSTFHNNILDQFVENFAKNSSILVQKLGDSECAVTVNVYPLISLCTLDVICETAMGTKVNAQLDYDGEYVQNVLKSLQLLSERFMRPWLSVDWIFNLTQLGKEQAATLKYLHGNVQQVVSEKLAKFHASGRQKTQVDDVQSVNRKKLSLLDLLIEDGQLTPDEIHDEVVTIVAAGSETTASTCCYVLSLLGVHQDVQQRVFEEQRSVFGEDMNRLVTCEDLLHMPYLEQVIKESLRLFPPIPYLFRKVEQETDLGNGYVLPAGCYSMVVTYTTHRNPDHFPDPGRFDPDRFSPENSIGRHPYAYIPFGAGRRMCVAYKFGIMEAKTMLSTILRRFRVVETVGGIRTLVDSLESGVVLKPANGFNIKIEGFPLGNGVTSFQQIFDLPHRKQIILLAVSSVLPTSKLAAVTRDGEIICQ
ncbi:cytochrome P450 4C1 [Cryptotermes secundus]|uniref:cytochrome P450 4C1 n=1 Tax=Cryptotermes secundus TaxID=105785 RepID=UPI000CD7C623|nr:cytochrome P450 4C1 [Cryptotermes secundus]